MLARKQFPAPGAYDQMKRYVRKVRPRPPAEPVKRFETSPSHQGQVDFAEFRTPWDEAHPASGPLPRSGRSAPSAGQSQNRDIFIADNRDIFRAD